MKSANKEKALIGLAAGSGLLNPQMNEESEMNATAVTPKMQHALTFGTHEVRTVTREGQLWLSSEEIGRALEYATPSVSITRLYNRVSDEFTPTMTKIIKVMTAGGKQAVRFFSLRGAHLLAMFARTDKAKAFRVWVLDILDREVADLKAQAACGERLSPELKREVERICSHVENMRSWWGWVYPALHFLNRSLVGSVHDHFTSATICSRILVRELKLKSGRDYAARFPWGGSHDDKNLYNVNARGAA